MLRQEAWTLFRGPELVDACIHLQIDSVSGSEHNAPLGSWSRLFLSPARNPDACSGLSRRASRFGFRPSQARSNG
jgi:hypothetical protein